MWFWSVYWSTNCPVFFSFFLVDQKKIVQFQGIFGQSRGIFGRPKKNLVDQKKFWYTKKKFVQPKITRDWPKIPWDRTIFFGRPKKMRKRPDNWSTNRLTKTTWTGLLCTVDIFAMHLNSRGVIHTFVSEIFDGIVPGAKNTSKISRSEVAAPSWLAKFKTKTQWCRNFFEVEFAYLRYHLDVQVWNTFGVVSPLLIYKTVTL